MKRSTGYLVVCFPGLILPWIFIIKYLTTSSFTIANFFPDIFINNISSAVALDLIVSCGIFFIWMFHEAQQHNLSKKWIYIVASLLGGLSLGLPLFLFHREQRIEEANRKK